MTQIVTVTSSNFWSVIVATVTRSAMWISVNYAQEMLWLHYPTGAHETRALLPDISYILQSYSNPIGILKLKLQNDYDFSKNQLLPKLRSSSLVNETACVISKQGKLTKEL